LSLNYIHSHCKVTEAIQKLFNTVQTGDADLRFYVTTVQDG